MLVFSKGFVLFPLQDLVSDFRDLAGGLRRLNLVNSRIVNEQ